MNLPLQSRRQATCQSRRRFLRSSGVALALPLLDRFATPVLAADEPSSPHRLIFICTSLGIHGPNLFPDQTGSGYRSTKYLKVLEEFRDDLTVFSGLSHPDQAGSDGHSSERTWLTSAPHPGLDGFRNTVSVDMLAAEKLGYVTRFPSLTLGTKGASQSYTRSGVMVPAKHSPSRLYAELFLQGSESETKRQVQNLQDGRSILDAVAEEARMLVGASGHGDRQRLEEYFQSVREMEQRLKSAEAWVQRPKPSVDSKQPQDVQEEADLVGKTDLLFELIPLALKTDSTRVISMLIQGGGVPPIDGVDAEHHNLSHHGQDEAKLAQLERIEKMQIEALAGLLGALADVDEDGKRLLDSTSLVFGSNLGNANSHDWHNLPIILAGGGFKHGQHRAFDKEKNLPLSNLFLTMLQTQGHEIDQFGSSSGTLTV